GGEGGWLLHPVYRRSPARPDDRRCARPESVLLARRPQRWVPQLQDVLRTKRGARFYFRLGRHDVEAALADRLHDLLRHFGGPVRALAPAPWEGGYPVVNRPARPCPKACALGPALPCSASSGGRLRDDCMMFVSMSPGQTTDTPIGTPVTRNSLYMDSESATT